MQKKPVIVVSACLLGCKCRYDGGHRLCKAVCGALPASGVDWLPVCPEVGAGLGIPRPAASLFRTDSGRVRMLLNEGRADVTGSIEAWLGEFTGAMAGISGAILKARSPSCGWGTTPVLGGDGKQLELGSGLFAQALAEARPGMPIRDEGSFACERDCLDFLRELQLQD